jgi:hypothetical protein
MNTPYPTSAPARTSNPRFAAPPRLHSFRPRSSFADRCDLTQPWHEKSAVSILCGQHVNDARRALKFARGFLFALAIGILACIFTRQLLGSGLTFEILGHALGVGIILFVGSFLRLLFAESTLNSAQRDHERNLAADTEVEWRTNEANRRAEFIIDDSNRVASQAAPCCPPSQCVTNPVPKVERFDLAVSPQAEKELDQLIELLSGATPARKGKKAKQAKPGMKGAKSRRVNRRGLPA